MKNKETVIVALTALILFAALNVFMIASAPEAWTSIRYGAWTAFHKNFHFSGFDQSTYIVVSQWRPIFVHMRHPALIYMLWPLEQVNEWLRDAYGVNCTIYIVGVVWTLVSTLSWVVMYKIMRNVVGMRIHEALLLNVFFYSFAYVLLATFVPDHMILSMTVLLLMLYLSGKAMKKRSVLSGWKAALLFFFATGISTTNSIKILLIDAVARLRKERFLHFVKHCMIYVIPTVLLVGIYIYQEQTANVEEQQFQRRVRVQAIKKDSVGYANKVREGKQLTESRTNKQLVDNPLFEWTDMTIPIIPTLFDNIFGEGLQLHDKYLLGDANIANQRPVIVKYSNWYNYAVEYAVLLLFALGIIVGCRERFLWMCMMPFLFDMLLHVGLCFALTDVYIMTAHWAFVMPVAIAYLIKKVRKNTGVYISVFSAIMCITAFMLVWNVSLIVESVCRN